jgi:hypothetical protein
MSKLLEFKIWENNSSYSEKVMIHSLLCIGYAGRDEKKVMEHIEELEKIGVPRPKKVPEVYHLGTYLLATNEEINVVGDKSSGEVEFAILFHKGKTYIGIASDHTDRDLETVSIIKSKQVCQKPIATELWDYEDIKDHWNELILRSWIEINGDKVPYQEHAITAIIPFEKVIETIKEEVDGSLDGIFVLSGTVPLLEGFKYGTRFWASIEDPVSERKLELEYRINTLAK